MPVGLAAIVASGIAKADPWKTMFTSFKFSKGLYILPFLFFYRPEILLQGNLGDFAITTLVVICALTGLAAAIEGYWSTTLRLMERIMLFLAAGPLFIPGRLSDAVGFCFFVFVYLSQRRRAAHGNEKMSEEVFS